MRRTLAFTCSFLVLTQAGCLFSGRGVDTSPGGMIVRGFSSDGAPASESPEGPRREEKPTVGPRVDSPTIPSGDREPAKPVPNPAPLRGLGLEPPQAAGAQAERPAEGDPGNLFALPVAFQTCDLAPLMALAAGNPDPETRLDALSALALVGITLSLKAVCESSADSPYAHQIHHFANGVDDLLQPDDNQTQALRQRRPPYIFTLGWRY